MPAAGGFAGDLEDGLIGHLLLYHVRGVDGVGGFLRGGLLGGRGGDKTDTAAHRQRQQH